MNYRLFIVKKSTFLWASAFLLLASCQYSDGEQKKTEMPTPTRTLLISDNAWAGSSVNVIANVRQSLFTDGQTQYTAFYDRQGQLIMGKRQLGHANWQLQATEFTGNVKDAHNYISIVTDGEGYLHVSWDQHNTKLKYAVSLTPGGIDLKRHAMLNEQESAVTYPQFYRLANGDLLFQYRDGGSGHGNIVQNQYLTMEKRWLRLHNSLLDGENERSAYWDMSIDPQGVLHLAWIWRETPDVATNHDLHYIQSNDNGRHWQTIEGENLILPITQESVAPVWKIAQNHNLMNPPVVAADSQSRPYIASYWSENSKESPSMGVVSYQQGQWQAFRGKPSQQPFNLAGMGTKNPPWSRPLLLVDSNYQLTGFHLIYRDNNQKAIVVDSVPDIEKKSWHQARLLDWPADGWEPSSDPVQWQRKKQAHLLLQHVEQLDGNDAQASTIKGQALKLFIWEPKTSINQGDNEHN